MSRSFPQRSKGRYHLSIRLLLCLRRCKIARGMALCTAFPTLPLIPASNFVVRSRDSPSKDSFLTKPIYERHPICFSKVHSHEFILRCDDRLSVPRSRHIFFDFRDGFSYYFFQTVSVICQSRYRFRCRISFDMKSVFDNDGRQFAGLSGQTGR